MLRENSITSYAIIVVLAAVLIVSVNAIAQTKDNKFTSKEQSENKSLPQKKQIKKTVKPQEGLSHSLELSKKIAKLEEELSLTKTALFAEQQDGDEIYNKISILNESIKGLQAVVNEQNIELVALKAAHIKYNNVITCYRAGLSAWDKQLHLRSLTGEDRLTISTELRSVISRCPSIG
jgi:hypothetical protein